MLKINTTCDVSPYSRLHKIATQIYYNYAYSQHKHTNINTRMQNPKT